MNRTNTLNTPLIIELKTQHELQLNPPDFISSIGQSRPSRRSSSPTSWRSYFRQLMAPSKFSNTIVNTPDSSVESGCTNLPPLSHAAPSSRLARPMTPMEEMSQRFASLELSPTHPNTTYNTAEEPLNIAQQNLVTQELSVTTVVVRSSPAQEHRSCNGF